VEFELGVGAWFIKIIENHSIFVVYCKTGPTQF
jgi:hypothetical protein